MRFPDFPFLAWGENTECGCMTEARLEPPTGGLLPAAPDSDSVPSRFFLLYPPSRAVKFEPPKVHVPPRRYAAGGDCNLTAAAWRRLIAYKREGPGRKAGVKGRTALQCQSISTLIILQRYGHYSQIGQTELPSDARRACRTGLQPVPRCSGCRSAPEGASGSTQGNRA